MCAAICSPLPLPWSGFLSLLVRDTWPCVLSSKPASFPSLGQPQHRGALLLLGFSDWPSLQPVLVLVLLCYLLTLTGNSALESCWRCASRDYTRPCTTLCHLALVDAGFTTSVVPPLLANLRGREWRLERGGCLAQLCASLALGSAECVLLAVMALDPRSRRVVRCATPASPPAPLPRSAGAGLARWPHQLCRANRAPGRAAAVRARSGRPLHPAQLPALLQLACDGGGQDSTERQMFAARVFILLVPSAVILASMAAWPVLYGP